MAQGIEPREQEVAELRLFEEARRALQSFTAAKEELLRRITHRLRMADKLRQAIGRLLLGSPLGQFQSRADDCACRYADLRPKRDFPKYGNPIDVFYGDSLRVPSRADKWDEERRRQLHIALQQDLRMPRRVFGRLNLLDKSILRGLGQHGEALISAVRKLPCFNEMWNGKQPKAGFLVNDSLNACEKKFRKQYAAAYLLLCSQPLTPDDIYSIALCLRRMLPVSIVRHICSFSN